MKDDATQSQDKTTKIQIDDQSTGEVAEVSVTYTDTDMADQMMDDLQSHTKKQIPLDNIKKK